MQKYKHLRTRQRPAKNMFLVNLQYGDASKALSRVKNETGTDIYTYASIDTWHDLSGVFSLIDACDAIISIDNSTVHFAGSLGKEVMSYLQSLTTGDGDEHLRK